jgi:LPXTG-motif cell wall-anchored protein
LSPWRRAIVGDLTASLSLGRPADTSVPTDVLSVVPNRADPRVLTECTVTGTIGSLNANTQPIVQDPTIPANISQPKQEAAKGAVRRPVAPACPTTAKTPKGSGASGGGRDNNGSLADTGADIPSVALGAVGVAAAALLALALRRRLDINAD